MVGFCIVPLRCGVRNRPTVLRGIRAQRTPTGWASLLFCAVSLASAYFLSGLFGFNAGGGAGLIADGLGVSAAIGTADDAIEKPGVSEAVRQQLTASSAVAFAVTLYLHRGDCGRRHSQVMPTPLRGRASALYLAVTGLIGMGIGPTAVAVCTQYLFRRNDAVNYSLLLVCGVALMAVALLLWISSKAFLGSLDCLRVWSAANSEEG